MATAKQELGKGNEHKMNADNAHILFREWNLFQSSRGQFAFIYRRIFFSFVLILIFSSFLRCVSFAWLEFTSCWNGQQIVAVIIDFTCALIRRVHININIQMNLSSFIQFFYDRNIKRFSQAEKLSNLWNLWIHDFDINRIYFIFLFFFWPQKVKNKLFGDQPLNG